MSVAIILEIGEAFPLLDVPRRELHNPEWWGEAMYEDDHDSKSKRGLR